MMDSAFKSKIEGERKMKKNLILVLTFIAGMVPLFGQNYKNGQVIQRMTGLGKGYRNLTVERNDYGSGSQLYEDEYGTNVLYNFWSNAILVFHGNFSFGNSSVMGTDDKIVEILSRKDGVYTSVIPKGYTKGQKITIETLKKPEVWENITDFRIRLPANISGNYIEISTYKGADWATGQQNRKFGVILPGSDLTIHKAVKDPKDKNEYIPSVEMTMHPGAAIGWDKDFQAACNLEDSMKYLTYMASYSAQKEDVDARLKKRGNDKEKVKNELIEAVKNREVIYGTLAGGLPPFIGYPQAVDFIMKNQYRVPLLCSLGILYGRYTEQNKRNFDKLFKYDLYVLIAGKDSSGNFLGTVVDVDLEALATVTEKIATKYGMKSIAKQIPVVGTLIGFAKGGKEAASEITQFAKDAVEYYTKSAKVKEFQIDDFTGELYMYNGKDAKVTIPGNVKIIGEGVFKGTNIESVTIPQSVNEIKIDAFRECKKLTSVTINSNITIQGSAFLDCTALKTVTINSTKVDIKNNAFKGCTDLSDDTKTALRKLKYTGAGVGKGVTFQNNTGVNDNWSIERKNGSSWTSIATGSMKNGGKIEGVTLADGTYDLRLRSGNVPYCIIYQKKGVVVKDGTIVTFTKENEGYATREEYQKFIQARCGFSNENDIWKAMNTHPNADELYRIWAKSYPGDNRSNYSTRPAKKTDQEIIVEWCKFNDSQAKAVWAAAAKHSNAKALLQKWADSYFRK
jgi:hypothetical protein